MTDKPSRKSFNMPDIYIVPVILILPVAVLTRLIPAGPFGRQSPEIANGLKRAASFVPCLMQTLAITF